MSAYTKQEASWRAHGRLAEAAARCDREEDERELGWIAWTVADHHRGTMRLGQAGADQCDGHQSDDVCGHAVRVRENLSVSCAGRMERLLWAGRRASRPWC